jgi:uncharacterized protein YutE (UPF0331/DUF86 family)
MSRAIINKLNNLNKKAKDLKDAVKRARENRNRSYVDHVSYLVKGMSYIISDIGNQFFTLNIGRTINKVVIEKPLNLRDIFVKLGEAQIIPGNAVPHLNRLITMANNNTVDLDEVDKAIPALEVLVFYIKTFFDGIDFSDEAEEEIEFIMKKEEEEKKPFTTPPS